MKKLAIIFILVSCLFSSLNATTKRSAAVAGTFYPADSSELMKMVNQHLNEVTDLPDIDGQIIALIVPHAGLVYSGGIAAYSYKLLEDSPVENVILCGPSHRYRFQGISVYGPYISWTMPFGAVQCNKKIGLSLLKFSEEIQFLVEPHREEHSLEVQLPYLKAVLDEFRITPVAMGNQDGPTIKILADALSSLEFDSTTVMIAATDWQHYRPASEGWKLDSLGLAAIENLDPLRLQTELARKTVEMCGGGPTVAVIKAAIAKGADKVKILKYGDSGDKSGDKSSVVGYAAAVIYKSNDKQKKEKAEKMKSDKTRNQENLPEEFELTDNDKAQLLNIARRSLEKYLESGETMEFEVSDNLKKPGAGFVTLEKNGRLRGCIGHTTAVEPLHKTISSCAIKAAVSDPRFSPVTREELTDLHIEISVLTPLQKINNFDEIKVGRDGLMIFKGSNRGLLLPQVATDYGWDRKTFLEQTCQKAGLPFDAYLQKDAAIFKFQAIVFSE